MAVRAAGGADLLPPPVVTTDEGADPLRALEVDALPPDREVCRAALARLVADAVPRMCLVDPREGLVLDVGHEVGAAVVAGVTEQVAVDLVVVEEAADHDPGSPRHGGGVNAAIGWFALRSARSTGCDQPVDRQGTCG
ncbi:hypothetical protein ACFQV8_06610 [Pseudonocardia benzenivorans]